MGRSGSQGDRRTSREDGAQLSEPAVPKGPSGQRVREHRPQRDADGPLELALQNPNRYPEAAARRLRPWLLRLVGELAPGAASFGVRFAGDRELRRVNRELRGKDAPTDVLSFPGEEGPEGHHLGDVLISVPTARRQAAEAGHSTERELRVLLLHGILHCLGHDHETDDGTMERLERRLRRAWIPADTA